MSIVITTGEIVAAAGDAYGAYQGAMSEPINDGEWSVAA